MLDIILEDLKKAAMSYYTLTGMPIVLYDETRNLLFAYPSSLSDFCETIRQNPTLLNKCHDCDRIGFDCCDKAHATYIYKCHMNLIEVITPIYENEMLIGYMMTGEILEDNNIKLVNESILKVSKEYNLNPKHLQNALKKQPVRNEAFIKSATDVMSMCISYLYCNKIIKNNTEVVSYQLREYIDNHLKEEFSISNISNMLFVSKSKLYEISKEAFGMGITDYIRLHRIEKSKELLKSTKKSVSQIAEEVGIYDANYFSRIFKQYEDCTPTAYRKKTV